VDKMHLAGGWGKYIAPVTLHDELIYDAVAYAAMVAPVFTLDFNQYKVPGGQVLLIRSVTVRSPWHSFSTVTMQGVLSAEAGVRRGMADYGVAPLLGTNLPRADKGIINIEAPGTVTGLAIQILPGTMPVITVAGVPFDEFSTAQGGVAAYITGELLENPR
jgi:hypothetical protein